MDNTARPADRKISPSGSMFKKVLQAFVNGDLPYSDVQSDLQRMLTAGAAPEELRDVLHRYESIEPLPGYARAEVLRVLNEAIDRAAVLDGEPDSAQSQPPDTPPAPASGPAAAPETRPGEKPLGPIGVAAVSRPAAGRAPAVGAEPATSPVENVSSIEERIARQRADYKALNHAYERARDAGSAAAARTIALTAELVAVRSALEAEQTRARTLDQSLAESLASAEAARARGGEVRQESERDRTELRAARELLAARDAAIEQLRLSLGEREERLAAQQGEHTARAAALGAELADARSALRSAQLKIQEADKALAAKPAIDQTVRGPSEDARRESERIQVELGRLRESLAARDAAIAQNRSALGERDAQFTALQREHTQTTAELESRKRSSAQVEADLQTSRARVVALTADLASAHAALAAEQKKTRDNHQALLDRVAADDTAQARGAEALRKSESQRVELSKVRDSIATRQQEHARVVAAMEERTRTLEAQLQTARTRGDEPGEWKGNHDITVAIDAPRERAGAARAPDRQTAAPQRDFARETALVAAPEPKRAAQLPAFPLFGSRGGSTGGRAARIIGVGVALAVVAVVAWKIVQHAPVAESVPVSAAVPKPGEVIRDCPTCPALTVVPAGRFKQGSDRTDGKSASFEKPPHWVMIGRPFAISTNAVTVDEFRAFVAASGRDMRGCDTYDDRWRVRPDSSWENPGFVQTGAHPVTCVSWDDAKAYAAWLSKTTGHHYALPSAAEWEYAARAGGEAVRPWASDGPSACASANVADQRAARRYPGWAVFTCDDGYVYTAPVGSFKSNAFGLNDMLGNVFQWTDDCWHADYTGVPVDGSARTYGDCTERELRGGSWFTTPDFVRASYRNHFGTNYRASSVGIRLVRDIGS